MSDSAVNTVPGAPAAARSSFYAGMRVLPKAEREAMYAVYDFCRIVDDIADDADDGGKLMHRAIDLDGGDGGAFQRGKEHATEGVSDGVAVPGFKGIGDEFGIGGRLG